MITVPGTLSIRSIQGRNGVFSVGRLATEIGTFAVKDALLDQYEPGQYTGVFDIARIHPSVYPCHGQMVVEVRAKLAGMALDAIASLPDNRPRDIAVDPIEPELSPPVETFSEPEEPPILAHALEPDAHGPGAPPDGSEGEGNSDDALLFGPLWPLGVALKLDTTVARILLRRQRDRLKALGWRFDAKTQTWSTPETWLTPN